MMGGTNVVAVAVRFLVVVDELMRMQMTVVVVGVAGLKE